MSNQTEYQDTIYNHIISVFYFVEKQDFVSKISFSKNMHERLLKEEHWDKNKIWGATIAVTEKSVDTITCYWNRSPNESF